MIILDSAILSGASVCGHATLRDFPTPVCDDSMINGYTDSSAHQYLFKWVWTGGFLYTVKQRSTDEAAQVCSPPIQYFFQVLPSLGSMHSNTFTATTVRTSILT